MLYEYIMPYFFTANLFRQAAELTPQYEHKCFPSHFPVDVAAGGGVQAGGLQFMVCMTA
jgi:hypothetical protein